MQERHSYEQEPNGRISITLKIAHGTAHNSTLIINP